MSEMEEVRAELARMRAELDELRARPGHPTGPTDPGPAEPERSASGPIPRRVALRHAGALAAGAVAGGAALVAVSASPAAAATVTGSGNPGVQATGQSGDGVTATTNANGKAAVRATTSTAGAVAVFAGHGGAASAAGTALSASGAGAGLANPTAVLNNTGGGLALRALAAGGVAARLEGRVQVSVPSNGDGPGLTVESPTRGIDLRATGTADGVRVFAGGFGLDAAAPVAARLNGTTHLRLIPGFTLAPPPPQQTDAGAMGRAVGDVVMHGSDLWLCVGAPPAIGVPATWRLLAGASSVGALDLLPVPGRAYDSRPSTTPAVGSKTKLQPGVTRVVDLTAGGAVALPPGATASVLTLLLVNATTGNGNLTVWANGQPRPQSNTMVWGGDAGRFTATAVTRIDGTGKVQVLASLATDIVVDVVGFHR